MIKKKVRYEVIAANVDKDMGLDAGTTDKVISTCMEVLIDKLSTFEYATVGIRHLGVFRPSIRKFYSLKKFLESPIADKTGDYEYYRQVIEDFSPHVESHMKSLRKKIFMQDEEHTTK